MRRILGVAVTAALLSAALRANAQDESVADALYREGQRLIDAGKLHEACAKFAESQRLDPAAGTLIATAACHEKEGKTATAWTEFKDAVELAQRAHEVARERYARTHASALEATVFHLTLDLPSPPPGVEIKVDARPLGLAVVGTPFPLDPGSHHVEVTAPGAPSWTKDVPVPPAGGSLRLVVSFVGAASAPHSKGAPAPSDIRPYVAPVAIAGAGVVAVLAGAVMLGVAGANGNSAVQAAMAATNSAAYASAESERDGALTLQTVGLVLGAAGLIATGVGGVWIVKLATTTPSASAQGGGVAVRPTAFPIGMHGGALGVGVTF